MGTAAEGCRRRGRGRAEGTSSRARPARGGGRPRRMSSPPRTRTRGRPWRMSLRVNEPAGEGGEKERGRGRGATTEVVASAGAAARDGNGGRGFERTRLLDGGVDAAANGSLFVSVCPVLPQSDQPEKRSWSKTCQIAVYPLVGAQTTGAAFCHHFLPLWSKSQPKSFEQQAILSSVGDSDHLC